MGMVEEAPIVNVGKLESGETVSEESRERSSSSRRP